MPSMSKAKTTKELVKHLLNDVHGVSGIGLTWDEKGEPAVLVKVTKDAHYDVQSRLSQIDFGVPIVIEETGIITFEKRST